MKPQMTLKMRMSVDCSQHQRYTEEDIMLEFAKDNIKINRKLVVRKTDGAVMGEILMETPTKVCSNCGHFIDLNQTAELPKEFTF